MSIEDKIRNELDTIIVPGVERSLVKMNLLHSIGVNEGKGKISLLAAALIPEVQQEIKDKVIEVVSSLEGIKEISVSFTEAKPKDINKIGHVIAVMSGKGGVGKSLVASLTAIALRRQGFEVGVLDADITGPSIPRMFGLNTRCTGSNTGILPVSSKSGIEVMSINLLLPNEDDAVIWRGPLIGRTITQFWEDALWGTLDYLVVDLPPGTADAPLTVMQTLPVSGVIIVFTPQELTAMVVRKAVNMAQQMDKPILGVVENMSYLYVPEIKKKIEIFGKSRGEEMARTAKAPILGQLPIDPELAKLCDEGKIENYNSAVMTEFSESLAQSVKTFL